MQTRSLLLILGSLSFLFGGAGVVVVSKLAQEPGGGSETVPAPRGNGLAIEVPADATAAAASDPESDRIQANEASAIATLVMIAGAQTAVQSAGAVDVDEDGKGEFAWLGELAGTIPLRERNLEGRTHVGKMVLDPTLLPSRFGTANGQPERSGYLFRLYLPGAAVEDRAAGIVQGAPTYPDPVNSSERWCCYAWPVTVGATGNRVFFVDQEGEILETSNADKAYSGANRGPAFDAALKAEHPKDMLAPTGGNGQRTNDRHTWRSVVR
jgi:hypothetical protein